MENEKTSAPGPRRVRDDQTQVLGEEDMVEVDPSAPEAVDRGWIAADARARRAPASTLRRVV
jgi:hypothetical protein